MTQKKPRIQHNSMILVKFLIIASIFSVEEKDSVCKEMMSIKAFILCCIVIFLDTRKERQTVEQINNKKCIQTSSKRSIIVEWKWKKKKKIVFTEIIYKLIDWAFHMWNFSSLFGFFLYWNSRASSSSYLLKFFLFNSMQFLINFWEFPSLVEITAFHSRCSRASVWRLLNWHLQNYKSACLLCMCNSMNFQEIHTTMSHMNDFTGS